MNIIYADSLFALSLLTDYLLCLVTARFCGLVLRRGRYAAAALVGALYAVAVFLPGCGFLAAPVMELAAAVLMGLIAFGCERRLGRCVAVFLTLSATFGGAVWAISLRLGAVPAPDLHLLALCFAGCYAVLSLISRTRHRRAERHCVPAALALSGRRAQFRALIDTGNCLRDSLTGAPVMIVSPAALRPLFGGHAGLLELEDAVELVSAADTAEPLRGRFRLLSCTTLGGTGLLAVFRPDLVLVDGRERPGMLAAVSARAAGDGFEAIV